MKKRLSIASIALACAALCFPASLALGDVTVPHYRIVPVEPRKPVKTATSASASASASASPSEPAKSFAEAPPAEEKSKAPTLAEWKDAPRVTLEREEPLCRSYRVREWLKIHCSGFPAAGVSLLAGQGEGVSAWVPPPKTEGTAAMKEASFAELIFPVRRGDGRVFQVAQFGPGYDGPLGWNVVLIVSEVWPAGEPAPIITVRSMQR